jgi:hypothetical protein
MAHAIIANEQYAVIDLKLAIAETNGDAIADGLNELLRENLDKDFIADYAFYNTDEPTLKTASREPEEGELFEDVKLGYRELKTLSAAINLFNSEHAYVDFDDLHDDMIVDNASLTLMTNKFWNLGRAMYDVSVYADAASAETTPLLTSNEKITLKYVLNHFINCIGVESELTLTDGDGDVILDKAVLEQLKAKVNILCN